MSEFSNQLVVVTGAGTGIGRATALDFAKRGATVIITGRRKEKLDEVAVLNPAIVPLVADVTTDEGTELVASAVQARGQLDVLVNNAGTHYMGPVGGLDLAKVREVFGTNVVAQIALTNRLVPLMRNPGNIVFITSPAGSNPVPIASIYGASKAAVTSLTRSWALELAPKGIRVNAVAPGWVRTEVYETHGGMTSEQVDGMFEHVAKTVPLGFTGVPEDVSLWVLRICESSSAWFTGQIITMDGGAELVRSQQT